MYWFRKAHDHLEPGQRGGLVGTNSVSQNRARGVSLDYLAANGGVITDAVSTQVWPGEAAVHVSLVNWVKKPPEPPTTFTLDGTPVAEISTSLRMAGAARAEVLDGNVGRSFQGPIPGDEGFIIDRAEAIALLKRGDADYKRVVRPYLIGKDITTQPGGLPSRWVIDFGSMSLENAEGYPAALAIVRQRVKPRREQNRRKAYREYWWRFSEPRARMRAATAGFDRYVAGTATGKRLLLTWTSADVCPSNLVNVFAFDDDYAMGVLLSCAHGSWAWAQSSTLKGDLRYTPTTVFATFPWPSPDDAQRARIAEIAKRLIELRDKLSIERNIGLTTLYNECDEGAHKELRELHGQLDREVSDAYGWSASVLSDPVEITSRLLALNAAIAAGDQEYIPFAPLTPPEAPQSERLFVPDGELL